MADEETARAQAKVSVPEECVDSPNEALVLTNCRDDT